MKKFLSVIFVVIFFVFITQTSVVQGQPRYASCDLCGLCQANGVAQTPPSNWETCRQCLYPSAAPQINSLDTLKVEPTTNLPPTPYEGHQYTMIGCIRTDLQLIAQPGQQGSAASVVQIILNILFGVIGAIAFLYLLYGSFVILTSRADVERLNYGKRLVMGSVIGVVFTLLSTFVVNFLATGILKIPGF